VNLRYRNGYYAVDFSKGSKKEKETELASAVGLSALAPSTMVLFDARVVPPPPAAKATFPVQFRVLPGNFTADDAGDKGKHLNLDFFVTASQNGRIATNAGMSVNTDVTNEQFQQIQQQGILLPVEVTLPPGKYELMLAVRDNPSGMVGTLDVPLELQAPGK
jgi:hypothetical protein